MINVESYMALVRYHAGTFGLKAHEDDLIGAGMIGLVEAAQKFNPRHKAKFTTYAYRRIRGAMQDYLRKWQGAGLRMRNHVKQKRLDIKIIPLDVAFGGNGDGGRALEPGSPQEPSLKHTTLGSEIMSSAHELCTEQEVQCLKLRFEGKGMFLGAVGEKLGLSESRACQLCNSAINKLRAHYRTS